MTGMTTQTKSEKVVVRADPDADDCLAAAAEAYTLAHPHTLGWNLDPQWGDPERETVVLTVPVQS